MEFEEYLKIGSGPVLLTDNKVELKSPHTAQTFFCDWCTLKHGVPHGSILGPVLFKIYISDLPQRINSESEPILFVDDTRVVHNFQAEISNISVQCQI